MMTKERAELTAGIIILGIGIGAFAVGYFVLHSFVQHDATCQQNTNCIATSGALYALFGVLKYVGVVITVPGLIAVARTWKTMQATKSVDSKIASNPHNPNLYIRRARRYLDHKQYEQALADCNMAIGHGPNLAGAYNLRGVVWQRTGHYDKARTDYQQAAKLSPEKAIFQSNLQKIERLLQNNATASN